MNRLRPERRAEVLLMLCMGASMRGVARASGVSVNTAAKLLTDAGEVCARLHDDLVRGVRTEQVDCYKSWSRDCGTASGVWTWSAVARESDLVVAWRLGGIETADARGFAAEVGARTAHGAPTLTEAELQAACADDAPFAFDLAQGRLRPLTDDRPGMGRRIEKRRFTRLRNAYSRTFENFSRMVAIYTFWNNFMKIGPEGRTPAMTAGLADRVWTPADIFALIDAPRDRAA